MDLPVTNLDIDLPDVDVRIDVETQMDLPVVDIHSAKDPVCLSAHDLAQLNPFRFVQS